MILIAAIVSLLLLGSSLVAIPAAAEGSTATITYDGSVEYLSTGESGKVVVHVSGVTGNYSWTAKIDDGTLSAKSGTTSADNFTTTVTAPDTTGDITLTVTVNGTANATSTYAIHVINPTVLKATVVNTGNLTLQNLPVQFIVDGKVVNETTFTIPANSTKDLTYNWTAPNLSDGAHTLKVVLDPNNEAVRFIDGTTTFTTTFYHGSSSFEWINILLVLVLVILLLVAFFSYMNRGRKRKK